MTIKSGPQRTDIGKPDDRIRSTLHAKDGDHVRRGPKGEAFQSKSCTRARMSRARVTASIGMPVVFSSRQRRIEYPPFGQPTNVGRWGKFPRAQPDGPRSALNESSLTQLGDCLLQFGLGIHYNWSVPGDWFLDRFSGYQQETNAVLARLYVDLVAGIEQHQRTVPGLFPYQDFVAICLFLAQHADV